MSYFKTPQHPVNYNLRTSSISPSCCSCVLYLPQLQRGYSEDGCIWQHFVLEQSCGLTESLSIAAMEIRTCLRTRCLNWFTFLFQVVFRLGAWARVLESKHIFQQSNRMAKLTKHQSVINICHDVRNEYQIDWMHMTPRAKDKVVPQYICLVAVTCLVNSGM